MNDLSWILYWAEVGPKIATSIGFWGTALSLIALVLAGVMTAAFVTVTMGGDLEADPDKVKLITLVIRTLWIIFILSGLTALSTNFIPSKQTLYAIAASELGEDVLKSPEATKARALLNKAMDQLDAKLDETKPKEVPNE